MRKTLAALAVLLVACAALALAATQADAQRARATPTPNENITPPGEIPVIPTPDALVTFRLTIYGEVPDGEYFNLGFDAGGTSFCGNLEGECEGGGKAYTATFQAHSGETSPYTLWRRRNEGTPGVDRQVLLLETVVDSALTPRGDTTVELHYTYGEDGKPLGGGKGPGEAPPI